MFGDKYFVNKSKVFDGKTTLLLKLYRMIPTVTSLVICFLYDIVCKFKLNTRPTIESQRSKDNCFNITIKTDKSSTMYTLMSIFSSNGYNLRFGVIELRMYSYGNTLENQNNEKNNSHTKFQFYTKIENDDKQRPNVQKMYQSIFYEWKDKSYLSLNQSDEEGTNIKYFNENDPTCDHPKTEVSIRSGIDPISNTNSNEENSASHYQSPMNRRSKIKTNRTKQQNNRNTRKPLLIVSADYIVRQSFEEYLFSKRQYEERPMVLWPPIHPLLPFKNRRLDHDSI